jgi:hypothetical protein
VADPQPELGSLSVDDVVLAAASTLASVAYARLEASDLPEAKRAIDALSSLLPHVEGDLGGELRRVLTSLQVAFAGAASP